MNLDAVKKNVRVALKEDSVRQDLSIKAVSYTHLTLPTK